MKKNTPKAIHAASREHADGLAAAERAALGAAMRRNAHLVTPERSLTPFEELVAREASDHSDEEALIREEAIGTWLGWLFEGGIKIEEATKRLFVFARGFRPELILNMSGAEIAALFGQTRAAESHRSRKVIEATLRKAGAKFTDQPYQKSATTRRKCAASAMGNRNRANKAA